MEYFKILPEEITLDILSRIPTESLSDSKLVCTDWNKLISYHPSFSKMHSHHHLNYVDSNSGKLGFIVLTRSNFFKFHYFEYTENHDQSGTPIQCIKRFNFTSPFKYTSVVGSYNGLIGLSKDDHDPSVCICNPITREYVMLPKIKTDSDYYSWSDGFGYISSTNEYKAVVILLLKTEFVEVHIYTLGSGSGWRNLGKFNSQFNSYWNPGIFANGALYWKGRGLQMILTFDMVEEKFCEHLAPPPLPIGSDWIFNDIGVLDGLLFFAIYLIDEVGFMRHDVWVLRKTNDNKDMKEGEEHQSLGWTKEFRVDTSRLLAVTKTDGVLTYFRNYLNIYDIKASISERLVDLKEQIRSVFPHKNTLVSLKELGEEDIKIMKAGEIEET